MPNKDAKKFIQKALAYEGDDCLIWPHKKGRFGYPLVRSDEPPKFKWRAAHRWICILAHGEPQAPEYHAAHSCGNGHLGCVNPRHLRWLTPEENYAERAIHGQAKPNGYTYNAGEKNGRAKLTANDVRKIRALAIGMTNKEIAGRYGLRSSTISSIISRKSWAKVA